MKFLDLNRFFKEIILEIYIVWCGQCYHTFFLTNEYSESSQTHDGLAKFYYYINKWCVYSKCLLKTSETKFFNSFAQG